MKKTAKIAKPPAIVEQEHGRYLIKAGQLQGTIVARAFPKPPSKFRHLVAEETGKTTDDAIVRLIEKLDGLRAKSRALRRADPSLDTGVPTLVEFADALRSYTPGPKVLDILHDHALLRQRGAQLSDLAKTGNFASPQDLLNAYEKLGVEIYKQIDPDEALVAGLPLIVQMPESGALENTDMAILHPELQDAVLQLLGTIRRKR
ncbi:hypothetical protein [Yoonia sp.]|uniref:hypothetical protein n=1 Tax=Yoonia sp. TaxID=2212373 RepID=UPI003A4D8692|nr:hypothetical protein [Loktanella sp.]